MSAFVEFLLIGLANGLVYSLIALGFTVIFNATRILNFAQGAYVMLGGMLAYAAFTFWRAPEWMALGFGVLATVALGAVTYLLVVNRLLARRASLSVVMIALFGVHVILENGALVGIASTGVGYPAFVSWPPIPIFGVPLSWQTVWIALGAAGAMAALNVFFLAVPVGKAMRAAAANPLAARLVGVPVERMALYSFMLSAGLGALGGVLITPAQFTAFNVGLPFALKGFTGAMIGGFGNVWGAAAGGVILGVVEALTVGYVSTKYKDAITFLLLLVILLARPQGLFGSLVEDEERH